MYRLPSGPNSMSTKSVNPPLPGSTNTSMKAPVLALKRKTSSPAVVPT
ncbi:hypothetical protein LILAB_04340 [Corallococcus macrosporus]|uniref:Uncharacterized protein n=1 Tax=Myxococcus fulvus (strain ATCC BAA-855 / HW-1) TaxID=483219 RepID=F8CM22_MYXFH|nr:hypothetical protein LILAB_04340 [Corallococcus macrosporus]